MQHVRCLVRLTKMIFHKLQIAQDKHEEFFACYLRVRRDYNIRGVIKWIEEEITKGNYGDYTLVSSSYFTSTTTTQTSTTTNLKDTIYHHSDSDEEFAKLLENQIFQEYLRKICEKNKMTESDVRTCIPRLYHQSLKAPRMYLEGDVVIDARFFSPNEILALGSILKIYNIYYFYHGENGCLDKFPFEI